MQETCVWATHQAGEWLPKLLSGHPIPAQGAPGPGQFMFLVTLEDTIGLEDQEKIKELLTSKTMSANLQVSPGLLVLLQPLNYSLTQQKAKMWALQL